MKAGSKNQPGNSAKDSNRMPAESAFYNRLVPIILVGLAALTAILVLAAAGILFGILPV